MTHSKRGTLTEKSCARSHHSGALNWMPKRGPPSTSCNDSSMIRRLAATWVTCASDYCPKPTACPAIKCYAPKNQRVVAKGGAGNTYMQENLLELIATTQDPVSIPFWLDIVNLARPRDSFTTKRRTYAAASLARLAIQTNSAEAYAALRHLAQHPRADVRALAVYYLGCAYRDVERVVPTEVIAELSEIAVRDSSFEPRFQARALLRDTENSVPLDNPGGVYAFKVKYRWAPGITRTIELKSEQTLWDLHQAIQRALKWGDNHFYSFFMNGQKWDRRYAFASPDDEDHPPFVDEAVIGELGLTPKHKFMYYFDYGDGHEFQIQVVGVYPQARPSDYPCATASQGEIAQYPSWEEE